MEIEYSIFIFTNLFLLLNLLNSCFVFRRFHRLETRVKLLEDFNESQLTQNQNQNQNQNQRTQQTVIASYTPSTVATYPQINTYPPMNSYPTSYTTYQAPSAPLATAPLASAPPFAQPYRSQGPVL